METMITVKRNLDGLNEVYLDVTKAWWTIQEVIAVCHALGFQVRLIDTETIDRSFRESQNQNVADCSP